MIPASKSERNTESTRHHKKGSIGKVDAYWKFATEAWKAREKGM